MIDLTKVSKEDVVRQWIDALRSGKYEQGKTALRRADDTYCCLGVLCDVIGVEWTPTTDSTGLAVYEATFCDSPADHEYLPVGIAEALNVTCEGDGFAEQNRSLAVLNDSYDWTFSQIADAIEEHIFGTTNPA